MKLVCHNFLSSRFLKGASGGYPLGLNVKQKTEENTAYSEIMVKRMLPKIEYQVLKAAAESIGEGDGLPDVLPENPDEALLQKLHHVMFCVEIVDGELICPDTGRIFPIKEGIPNMLCNEEECI